LECPACSNKNAYVGLSGVECPNKECRHYSARQAEDVLRNKVTSTPREVEEDDLPDEHEYLTQYLWGTYHTDIGW
jgi:hypothetical protein